MSNHRRCYTHKEAIHTVKDWMRRRGMNRQTELVAWLDQRGITLSPQYLNDLFHGTRAPGPRFIQAFREITGIQLEAGLVQSQDGKARI